VRSLVYTQSFKLCGLVFGVDERQRFECPHLTGKTLPYFFYCSEYDMRLISCPYPTLVSFLLASGIFPMNRNLRIQMLNKKLNTRSNKVLNIFIEIIYHIWLY